MKNQNIYYSTKDKIVFWIAGYTEFSSCHNVLEFIKMLDYHSKHFSELLKVEQKTVWTFDVRKSRQFFAMRVFYTQFNVTPVLPQDTRVIDESMFDYVQRD